MTRTPSKTKIRKALQRFGLYRLTNPGSLYTEPAPAGLIGTAFNACGPNKAACQTYTWRTIGPRLYVIVEDHTWAPYGPVTVKATCRLDRQRIRWTVEAGATGELCRF